MALTARQIVILINESAGFSITYTPHNLACFNSWHQLIESSKGNIRIQFNDSGLQDLVTLTMELFWYENDLRNSDGSKITDKIHLHYYYGFPKKWETII